MARYAATVTSDRSAEDAFAYMSDFTNTRHWDPGVRDAHADTTPPQLDAVYRLSYAMLGRTTELVYRVVGIDPPHSITLECETPFLRIRDHITVAPDPAGSRITYEATVTLASVLGLADPLLAVGFRRNADKALAGLRSAIGTG